MFSLSCGMGCQPYKQEQPYKLEQHICGLILTILMFKITSGPHQNAGEMRFPLQHSEASSHQYIMHKQPFTFLFFERLHIIKRKSKKGKRVNRKSENLATKTKQKLCHLWHKAVTSVLIMKMRTLGT